MKLAGRRVLRGSRASDVTRTCLYRPEFFGAAFLRLHDDVMRGPSTWTHAERQLFAAFVSSQNHCVF